MRVERRFYHEINYVFIYNYSSNVFSDSSVFSVIQLLFKSEICFLYFFESSDEMFLGKKVTENNSSERPLINSGVELDSQLN